MPEKISLMVSIQVDRGPKITVADNLEVEGYDKLNLTIPAGATDMEVQIQPGDAGKVQLLLIKSDTYGPELTYTVNGAGAAIKLDKVQLLIGEGAVGLLGAPPSTLNITNGLTAPATIEILIGRKVRDPVEEPPGPVPSPPAPNEAPPASGRAGKSGAAGDDTTGGASDPSAAESESTPDGGRPAPPGGKPTK